MEKQLLNDLSSSDVREVLSALQSANDLSQRYDLQSAFVDKLFHSIVPLLTHTHYKIRAHAFSLLLTVLSEYGDSISAIDVVVPSLLLSIISVNKEVADTAVKCLAIVFRLTETVSFWPDVEGVICDGRSGVSRIKILDLLVEFADRIPLEPIVRLLDDPKAQIRASAMKILNAADHGRVREVIASTRLSYEAMERLISSNAFEINDNAVNPVEQTQNGDWDLNSLARKNASKRRKAFDERNRTGNSIMNVGQSQQPRSYASISKRRKEIIEQSSRQAEPDFSERNSYSALARNKRNKQQGYDEFDQDFDDENEQMQVQYQQKRGERYKNQPPENQRGYNSRQLARSENAYRQNGARHQKRGNLKRIDRNRSISPSDTDIIRRTEDEANEEFLRLERQVKMETDNRPLGKIIPPPKVSLPVRPRDLTSATWLERVSFLEMLKESLAMSTRFKESPSQIVECVLTTAVPPHKKVTFLIPPILSEIILHHPEVLRNHLSSIIQFALNTMIGKVWQADTQFQQFLSVLYLESDPTELIDKALKIVDKNAHPLPYEIFILKAYEARSDIILPYSIVSHIVSRLLKKQAFDHDSSELFTLICIKEKKSVQKFGTSQSIENKRRIIPFLKIAQQNSESSQKVVHRVVEVSNDPHELKSIIDEEMSRGAKCDIPKLSAAFAKYPHDKCVKLFQPFILFVAQLPQRILTEYEEEFVRVCTTHFTDPKLLLFLDADYIESKVICGLSRCIWNCPSSILDGSDRYLPLLYNMFKESIGSTRYDLIQIFLAIYQKTKVSVLDLPAVVTPYRKLIEDMMAQFRIVVPKV